MIKSQNTQLVPRPQNNYTVGIYCKVNFLSFAATNRRCGSRNFRQGGSNFPKILTTSEKKIKKKGGGQKTGGCDAWLFPFCRSIHVV